MPRHAKTTENPHGYSYLRFSNPEQAKGDSFRRQIARRDEWLTRNNVTLDESVSLRDEGVSAFNGDHRDNPDRHALAAFLKLVESGRIPKGSYLIVESLDRLSREDIIPALSLVLNLIQAGIRIVQLAPVEMIYDKKCNPMHLMMAIMELSRGHSESAMKSERVGGAWQEKKRRAAAEGLPLTARVPGWLRLVDGKWLVIADAADAVRRIFRWAIDGYGIGVITKKLNSENVPPIGRAHYWARSYVAKILVNRAVIGEYQPYRGRAGKRQPDGKPISGYYPAVVTEAEWFAVRGALAARKNKAGRPAKATVNVFTNLLHDGRTGGTIHLVDKTSPTNKDGRVLIPYHATRGVAGGKSTSFPFKAFEHSVLSLLREIDPREVLPEKKGVNEALALSGRLAEVEGRLERLKARLRDDDDETVLDVVRELVEKRKALAQDLGRAQYEAGSPLAQAWADCRNLAEAVENAPDPNAARLKLRSALRRVVEGVWCLFVARGVVRMAAVQIYFTGGKRRDYLIVRRKSEANAAARKPARTWARSLASVAKPGTLDLRQPAHAAKLAATLQALDMDSLLSVMAG